MQQQNNRNPKPNRTNRKSPDYFRLCYGNPQRHPEPIFGMAHSRNMHHTSTLLSHYAYGHLKKIYAFSMHRCKNRPEQIKGNEDKIKKKNSKVEFCMECFALLGPCEYINCKNGQYTPSERINRARGGYYYHRHIAVCSLLPSSAALIKRPTTTNNNNHQAPRRGNIATMSERFDNRCRTKSRLSVICVSSALLQCIPRISCAQHLRSN